MCKSIIHFVFPGLINSCDVFCGFLDQRYQNHTKKPELELIWVLNDNKVSYASLMCLFSTIYGISSTKNTAMNETQVNPRMTAKMASTTVSCSLSSSTSSLSELNILA